MAQSIKLGSDLYISEYGVADGGTNLHTKLVINSVWSGHVTAGESITLTRRGLILLLVLGDQNNSLSTRSIAYAMGGNGTYYLPVAYANTPETIRYTLSGNTFTLNNVSNTSMYLHNVYTML